jgi:hypothetical protein
MLVDENAQPRAQRAGGEHPAEQQERREHEADLERLSPAAAEVAHVVARGRHGEQV